MVARPGDTERCARQLDRRAGAALEPPGSRPSTRSRPRLPGGQVPEGEYRFVVEGATRQAGATVPYLLESDPFAVHRWTGLTADDARLGDHGTASFRARTVYPRSHDSPFPFFAYDGNQVLCKTCSFRPSAATSEVISATVRITSPVRPPRSVEAPARRRPVARRGPPAAVGERHRPGRRPGRRVR